MLKRNYSSQEYKPQGDYRNIIKVLLPVSDKKKKAMKMDRRRRLHEPFPINIRLHNRIILYYYFPGTFVFHYPGQFIKWIARLVFFFFIERYHEISDVIIV